MPRISRAVDFGGVCMYIFLAILINRKKKSSYSKKFRKRHIKNTNNDWFAPMQLDDGLHIAEWFSKSMFSLN